MELDFWVAANIKSLPWVEGALVNKKSLARRQDSLCLNKGSPICSPLFNISNLAGISVPA